LEATVRLAATLVLPVVVAALALFAAAKPSGAATVPAGFTDVRVVGVEKPTAVAFTPDGRMLVATQPGRLNVYGQDGTPRKAGALDLGSRVCSNSERGLLGVAVDPQFAANNYVYVFYTANRSGTCVNRVSRFVLDPTTKRCLEREGSCGRHALARRQPQRRRRPLWQGRLPVR
jgi:glucose/arabinose dehydrogenase